ncbi:MAG: glycerol-3-phosphate 1-O-acyltransferase PlsY [bacterium]|nr:glycerol-3-phosphate 1-O-acyltransferase PlsY [bacterium]MDE0290206.1 glycerol-3-phosphate 1-O-acyltransferase PlsY [bacterium]MDE0437087.1 glycerol-3-phosphate 1-O-acyltransferase PlsY [bacterium]
MFIGITALCVSAYLLGSINTALVVAASRGVDIRAVGSGNPGASNVLRSLGKGPALLVTVADLLKGLLPALVGLLLWTPATAALAGFCAVAGHCYPVFHRFRGGKGVATAGGVALALSPPVMVAMVLMYGIGLAATRISAVGSLAAVVTSVPAFIIAGLETGAVVWFGATMLLIVLRHRSNLSRLRAGTERKLTP